MLRCAVPPVIMLCNEYNFETNMNKSKHIIFFFWSRLKNKIFFLLTKADVVYKETKEIHSSFLFFYGIFAWEILLGFLAMNSKALFLSFFYLKYLQLPGGLFSLVIVFGFKLNCEKKIVDLQIIFSILLRFEFLFVVNYKCQSKSIWKIV